LKKYLAILLPIILISGCRATDNSHSLEERIERLFASDYRAECVAEITSNKTKNKYSYVCEKVSGGAYIIDYGDMKITLSGEEALIEKNGEKISSPLSDGDLATVPEYFFNNYLNGGELKETDDGYILECDIKDGSYYRHRARMELSTNLHPENMSIKNKNGEEIIKIEISKFSQ